MIEARAPVRLDLSGGTLDIWPLHLSLPAPGVTVNVALDMPAFARVDARGDGRIRIVSRDLGEEVTYASAHAMQRAVLERDCPLLLLSTTLVELGIESGIELETEATVPTGSGLGGSSAVLVAVLAALGRTDLEEDDLAAMRILAQGIETRLMRKLTGYQDFYPPLFGGCLAIEGGIFGPEVEPLPVDLEALAARLRLVYTGEPHVSAEANWGVVKAFLERDPHAVRSIEGLGRIARNQRDALRRGDLDEALACLVEDGGLRRRMAEGVTTGPIEALDEAARGAGAMGTKICGAGGGGCVMVALPAGDSGPVDACLAASGLEVLPVKLTPDGVRITRN